MQSVNSPTHSISLRHLLPSASFVGCADIVVSSVSSDSRQCESGTLFAALPGTRVNGRDYAVQAVQAGATAVLTDHPLADVPVPQCVVANVRHAYGVICHELQCNPCRQLGIVGVTGTNGKTTTTWMVRSLLESAGHSCGIVGTIEYSDGRNSFASPLTTPDASRISELFASAVRQQTRHMAIEMSSHALDQERTAGTALDVGIITNITHDHLDYHESPERYLAAKLRIAELIKPGGVLLLNSDDANTRNVLERLDSSVRILTFGQSPDADTSASVSLESIDGTTLTFRHGVEEAECFLPLPGRHNVSNALAAVSAGVHLGLTLQEMARGLEAFDSVPGRLERVDVGQSFDVYVDYAHTEDALRRVIRTVKPLADGRVIVVFGAGGDRDPLKRGPMGTAAAEADVVFITSDNPRSEKPQAIIEQIEQGCRQAGKVPCIEVDRKRAIEKAFAEACAGDVVIVAGKGHERTQEILGVKHPLHDPTVCRDLLLCDASAMMTPHENLFSRP